MNKWIQKHLMRTYSIIFLGFGIFILVAPNVLMDILQSEHVNGYFWQILAFTYLLFISAVSWKAQTNMELMNLVIFIKVASAGIFLLAGVILMNFGLLLSGLVDTTLGTILICCKRFL